METKEWLDLEDTSLKELVAFRGYSVITETLTVHAQLSNTGVQNW